MAKRIKGSPYETGTVIVSETVLSSNSASVASVNWTSVRVGDGGTVLTGFPEYASSNGLGLEPDGKIVAVGSVGESKFSRVGIARYLGN